MTQPWMKFYPADWRSDPKLRMCSIAARGLWIEMVAVMHEAIPYGHMAVNGRAMTPREIGSLAGISTRTASKLLEELENNGVFSRDNGGIIFSRRMVRDAEKAQKDKENGAKGGNPKLKGGVNPQVKAQKPEARDQIPERSKSWPDGPPDFSKIYWSKLSDAEAKGVSASLMGRLLKVMDHTDACEILDHALTKGSPAQYLGGVIKQHSPSRKQSDLPPAIKAFADDGEPVQPLGNNRWKVGWDVMNERGEVVGF